jgi:hypothetical protein
MFAQGVLIRNDRRKHVRLALDVKLSRLPIVLRSSRIAILALSYDDFWHIDIYRT